MEGWIKIHRKLLEWEWHDDPNVLSVWIHLLLLANHDERRWRNTTVNRGQLITTIEGISEATGISVQSVRTALKKLENTCEISQKSTNKFRIITICKYDNYQFSNNIEQQTTNKQLTNNQQTTNKQLTTNKNIENIITRENNTPHTNACAYTREGNGESSGIIVLPIESLYNEYRAEIENGTKADQFALYYKNNFNYDLTREQILSYLESFQAWLGQQGISHKTMIDYRKHFSAWVQRQVKDKIKQQKQYGKPNTDRRPGTMSDILQVAQPTPGIESNF